MRRIPPGAPIVTAAQMRAAEQACFDAGIAQDELMERAGLAVAREVRRLAAGQAILVLAGPGNNGGDAYVAARLLANWGHDVTVATLGAPKAGAAARMVARWTGRSTTIAEACPSPILVDGLFGTGLARVLGDELSAKVAALCREAALVISIDLPSGVAADTGAADTGAADLAPVRADVTVALGAIKPAHLVGQGAAYSGHVVLADIGVPVTSRWHSLAAPVFTTPPPKSHKYSRGMVAVLSGAMPGAARLAARAALAGGAGYVVLAGRDLSPGPLDAIVHREVPTPGALSALLEDARVGALVIGPGLGRDAWASGMLDAALASDRDIVVDGDALTLLGSGCADRIRDRKGSVYLTPHASEFAQMFDASDESKIVRTINAAQATGATIVHKGADTVIARPSGAVTVAAGATPWLSTAGTGDVLAGLLAARHAGGDRDLAADAAVWLHSRAAALAGPSFSADALVDWLGDALASGAWR